MIVFNLLIAALTFSSTVINTEALLNSKSIKFRSNKKEPINFFWNEALIPQKQARVQPLLVSQKSNVVKEESFKGRTAFALAALVVQNSALAVLMRLSRVSKGIEFKMYYISTAVVISEFMKVIVSFIGCYYEDCGKDIEIMKEKIKTSSKWGDLLKISLPAGLYVLQNNLQYIAMSNLPAEVYQVLIQGKIITTALFSILVLNRRYSFVQWTSILALSLGVGLVQFSLKTSAVASNNINFAIGITSVLVSTLTSGFASVFLEKMLKSKGGFWIRNIQLSSVSFIIASLGCLIQDFNVVSTGGFFTGYNPLVLSVIFTQALGGMLVAFVVRYTNSIVKGFAASGSIILSCIISAIFLNDYKLGRLFTLGTGMVCASALTWAVSPTPSVGRVDTIESVKDLVGVASDPNISEVIEIQEDLVGVTSEVNEIQENNQENIQDNNYQEKRP